MEKQDQDHNIYDILDRIQGIHNKMGMEILSLREEMKKAEEIDKEFGESISAIMKHTRETLKNSQRDLVSGFEKGIKENLKR